MRRIHLWVGGLLWAAILSGCGGGGDSSQPQGGAAATNSPPPAAGAPGGAPGAMAGGPGAGAPNPGQMADMAKMMGGGMMGPPGGGGPPGAAAGGAAAAAAPDLSLISMLQYLPPTLNDACGFDVKSVLADKGNLSGQRLIRQFQPIFSMLARGNIKAEQVEYIWAGCNRKTGDLIIGVRTSGSTDGLLKAFQAGEPQKVGKHKLYLLPNPVAKNAVAVPEGKLLLLGRAETLTAALSGPQPGPVTKGLKAMANPTAFYWIAGDAAGAKKRMEGSAFALLEDYAAEGARMDGYALGIGGAGLDAAAAGGGGGGGPPAGGPPGGFPGGGPPGGGPPGGPPGSNRPQGGMAAGGMAAGMGGPPAGMMPQPGGPQSGGQPAQKADRSRINAVFGLSFQSEGLATTAEARLGELLKKYAPRQGGGGPGGMMGPGGGGAPGGGEAGGAPGAGGAAPPPPPPPPPDLRVSREIHLLEIPESLVPLSIPLKVSRDGKHFAQAGRPQGPPGGPPGGMGPGGMGPGGMGPGGMGPGGMGPGGMGPGGMPGGMPGAPGGAQANADKLIHCAVRRDADAIRLGLSIPNRPDLGVVFIDKAFNDAIQAMGATADYSGLYEGSLLTLRGGYQAMQTSSNAGLKGLRRLDPDMPLWVGFSWMSELLPHLGYSDLYKQFDFGKPWVEPTNLVHAFEVIPAFVNPADPNVQWNGHPYDGVGLTHFAGMAGLEDKRTVVAAELPRTDPRAGIFGYDEVAKLADITDGLPQTIMLIGTGKASAPWIQGGGGTVRGARAPFFDEFHGFSSAGLPAKGVFVLMADGSTRVINADIDPKVFSALCTMRGGEQVELPSTPPAAAGQTAQAGGQ